MRQLVLESAPTISTVRQQPREYGLSCHVRTQSQTSLVRCQLGSFLHLLYSLTLSHIPPPFRLQPLFSENPSPFTLLPNIYTPTYSDRLPLFSDTIPLTRITLLSLDSHHSSLIFVVLLISSTHPPLFAACILSHSSAICPCRLSGVQRTHICKLVRGARCGRDSSLCKYGARFGATAGSWSTQRGA